MFENVFCKLDEILSLIHTNLYQFYVWNINIIDLFKIND